ncbi:hypothetical protein BDW22DRAFT_348810 [Trametopsis cervina]|nr:hypothetical protein BDW22DRAFT_348810 [Trametopsis cervina]
MRACAARRDAHATSVLRLPGGGVRVGWIIIISTDQQRREQERPRANKFRKIIEHSFFVCDVMCLLVGGCMVWIADLSVHSGSANFGWALRTNRPNPTLACSPSLARTPPSSPNEQRPACALPLSLHHLTHCNLPVRADDRGNTLNTRPFRIREHIPSLGSLILSLQFPFQTLPATISAQQPTHTVFHRAYPYRPFSRSGNNI